MTNTGCTHPFSTGVDESPSEAPDKAWRCASCDEVFIFPVCDRPAFGTIETFSCRPEHLTEGMIVHLESGEVRTVMGIVRLYSYLGPDDVHVQFQNPDHPDLWLVVGETVEVEA